MYFLIQTRRFAFKVCLVKTKPKQNKNTPQALKTNNFALAFYVPKECFFLSMFGNAKSTCRIYRLEGTGGSCTSEYQCTELLPVMIPNEKVTFLTPVRMGSPTTRVLSVFMWVVRISSETKWFQSIICIYSLIKCIGFSHTLQKSVSLL